MALLIFERNFNNMDLDNAKTNVYAEKSGTYYVKISLPDLGIYVSGITVKKSVKYSGWWVQMPYYKDYKTGVAKRYIEFDQESPIRPRVEQLCIEAVEAKIDNSTRDYKDTVPTDEDLDKPLDLSHIPFN